MTVGSTPTTPYTLDFYLAARDAIWEADRYQLELDEALAKGVRAQDLQRSKWLLTRAERALRLAERFAADRSPVKVRRKRRKKNS